MAEHPAPADPGQEPGTEPVRRRVVFELRLEELPLLQRAERRHGTKRQALVRALEAEAEAEQQARELERARAQLAKLERELEAERKRAGEREAAAAKKERRNESARTKKERELAATQEQERTRAKRAEAEVATLERELAELETELARLQVEIPSHLFCARCGSWAPPKEWAWKRGFEGEYCYHRPCGDHGHEELLKPASRLGWRRR